MADLAVWQRTIVDEKGNVIPGAEVSVRSYPGGSLITLYEGPDGTQVKGNPFSTGADGFARFWAESQRAEIVAHGAGSTIRWIVDLLNADEVIGGAVSEATAAAADAVSEAKAEADRAEAARDAAQLNARVFPTTAAGLAATTDGDYFSVPSEDDDEYLILYRNDSGSATEVQRYPSAGGVERRLQGIEQVAPPLQLPVFDSNGIVLSGYETDGTYRVLQLAADTMELDGVDVGVGLAKPVDTDEFAFALTGESGEVFAGLDGDARWRTSSLSIGGATADEIEHPVFAWFVAGRDGVILAGLTHDGRWLPGGGDGGDVPPAHTVETVFVEPWLDPSENLMVTWITDSADATVMEYRVPGGSMWQSAASIRSRPFPALPGTYLHTALLLNLSFATTYECRFPGAIRREKFRTTPRRKPKIAMVSDFQSAYFDAEAPSRILGDHARQQGMDLLLIPGDHVNDDGRFEAFWSDRWMSYLKLLNDHYRHEDGGLVPWIALMGNHEGMNRQGTSSAGWGGDGTPGPMPDIFSWSYMDEHPTRFCNSAATCSIGNELFIISLETDHTEPLASQVDWLISQIAAAYQTHNWIIVIGHVPAFFPVADEDVKGHELPPSRLFRNIIYPALEPYADKIVAYGCGHTHCLCITPPLRVMYDESLTDEENDQRYTVDPALGIVQIGSGPLQVGYRNLDGTGALWRAERADDTSDLDGSRMFAAAMAWDVATQTLDIRGTGITNASVEAGPWHYWFFDFEESSPTATAYGIHGLPYLTYQKGA